MAYNIFSSDYGFINRIITRFGAKISFYTTPQVWPFILLFFNAGKELLWFISIVAIMELIHRFMKLQERCQCLPENFQNNHTND